MVRFAAPLASALPSEFVQYFFDPPSVAPLPMLDLLDRIRAGNFQLICVLPPAATWSRVRNSMLPGQPPLRSRSCPFGLDNLDPVASERALRANACCECSAWTSEQAASCSQCRLVLAFPEDFGGHWCDGPPRSGLATSTSRRNTCVKPGEEPRSCANSPRWTIGGPWGSSPTSRTCWLASLRAGRRCSL